MTDEPPALDDSFSSVLSTGAWIYRRGLTAFVVVWAAVLLPADILVAALYWRNALEGGLLILSINGVSGFAYIFVVLATADAVLANSATPVRDGARRALRRSPAQAWTALVSVLRLAPIVLAAGFVGGLTRNYHPLLPIAVSALAAAGLAYLIVVWGLSFATVMFSASSGGEALRLSGRLAKRRFWPFAAQYAGITLLLVVPALALFLAVSWAVISAGAPSWLAAFTGSTVTGLTLTPLMWAVYLALYRRENARAEPPAS